MLFFYFNFLGLLLLSGAIFLYFMAKKNLPKSLRKFIRKEKARIRREVFDIKKQEELISEIYQKLLKTKTK